jgi:cytochrome c553
MCLRLLALIAALAPAPAAAADPAGVDFFEKKVRPVLVGQCYKCHSAEANTFKGGLAVDTRGGLTQGGDTGPAVVPGKPKESLILKALRHDGLKMPNDTTKLPDEVAADFEKWVAMGAPDPRDGKSTARKGIDWAEARKHWAYQPVKPPAAPAVKDAGWPRTDLDRHVLSRIEAKGLAPAPDAAPHTLLRRMTFALTGLPPTPDELAAFEAAFSADPDKAVAAAADRLLASPRFGEYWARHWMDGVRYDQAAPGVGHYRDWLIRAFNADLPYDRFVTLQLAGDLLPPAGDPRADDDRRIATHMLTLNLGEMDVIEGMMEVAGQQLLGLSVNCAKCHDHKFDAFTQHDYYALAGVFTSTGVAGAPKGEFTTAVTLATAPGAKVPTLRDSVKSAGDTNLLVRGEKSQKGPVVPRRFPVVLAGDNQTPLGKFTKGSGRLELANWVASKDNPLTARVMVNRVWTWATGRAIVGTPNDFGAMGDKPVNPELLDHLAARFVADGWSVKALLKGVVTSRTFRQGSRAIGAVLAADPENALLARMPVRRLDAEQLADTLHFVGGVLDLGSPPLDAKPNGPGALKPPAVEKDRGAVGGYRAVHGVGLIPAKMFDAADPDLLTVRRDESVTAPQMLFFLNNPGVHQLAKLAAKRAGSPEAATRLLLGRGPTPAEAAFAGKHGLDRYCHLLLCSSEFLYVE